MLHKSLTNKVPTTEVLFNNFEGVIIDGLASWLLVIRYKLNHLYCFMFPLTPYPHPVQPSPQPLLINPERRICLHCSSNDKSEREKNEKQVLN